MCGACERVCTCAFVRVNVWCACLGLCARENFRVSFPIHPPTSHPLHFGRFIPTVSLQFLHVLRDCFPNHHMLLADFDSLPGGCACGDVRVWV